MAEAFGRFLDRHGHFFRTRTRNNAAVAHRYLRGLAQAEDCTFEAMAAVVEGGCAQQFQHFASNSPWEHEPVVAQIAADADRLLGGKATSCLLIDESSLPSWTYCRAIAIPLRPFIPCLAPDLVTLAQLCHRVLRDR